MLQSIFPGVMDMRDTGSHPALLAVVEQAVDAATQAAATGTFGVGGVLLGPTGQVLAVSCNHAISEGAVADPTAHGERQLVDWYFQQVHQGDCLPPPGECVIVSSLDPCIMCAGSILRSGFRVLSTTMDEAAGLNYTGDATYPSLDIAARKAADATFGYLAVQGRRAYQGPPNAPGHRIVLPAALEDRSRHGFLDSVEAVKEIIHASYGDVSDLRECDDPRLLEILKEHSPVALTVRTHPGQPAGAHLGAALLEEAERGSVRNSAALIDPHGNLVYLASGREDISPIRTAFMELTRGWARLHAAAGLPGKKYLAHLKDCTLVTLQGPGPDPVSFMELGAYGSSVEGPLGPSESARWQYVLARQSQAQLEATVAALPPLYSQIIKPRIEQVEDRQLKERCSR